MPQHKTTLLPLFIFIIASIVLSPFFSSFGAHEGKFEIKLKSRHFKPDISKPSSLEPRISHITKEGRERIHVIMQFCHIPDQAEKSALKNLGITFLSYIPEKSWFVSLPVSINQKKEAFAIVKWVGEIEPRDKIAPAIAEGNLGSWAYNHDETVNITITFFKDITINEGSAILKAKGNGLKIRKIHRYANRFVIKVNPKGIQLLAMLDEVQWINQIPPPKKLLNDGARQNTNVNLVHETPYSLVGNGVVVGIWDGGEVDGTHADFGGRVTVVDSVGISDHATHVAGTIGGNGALSESAGGTPNQWRGMAPAVDIISYYFDGVDNIDDHQHAIINYDIDISNNSWGYLISAAEENCDLYGNYDSYAPDYDNIVRGNFTKRVTILFAAGNERNDGDCGIASRDGYSCISPPATAKNVITIGAINSNDNSMTYFSSWGPVDDGRLKPDLVAPGCQRNGDRGITSTIPDENIDIYPKDNPDGIDDYDYPYDMMCGTSMATPVASGICSLIIEEFRNQNESDPLPSTIKALLINTAEDLGNPGPDYSYGYGKIDAKAAIDAIMAGEYDEGAFDGPNGVETYTFSVHPDTPKLQITLAWDDYPGTVNADPALVNQMDLLLYGPNGNLYRPWVLDANAPWVDANTGQDTINNVEQITINCPVSGNWIAYVVGAAIAEYPQTYSLVATYGISDHWGDMAIDTTWTAKASPHIVSGNIVVKPDATLTIEPGATIQFDGNFYIQVEGRLLAQGTAADPITFTSNAVIPAAGDWQGITFLNSTEYNPSVLEYCTMEYCNDGIYYNNKATFDPSTISHCTVRNYSRYGIYVTGANSTLTITDNLITQTLPSLIYTGTAIYCYSGPTLEVTGNTLEKNSRGIYAHSGYGVSTTLTIINNHIVDNADTGISSHAYSTSYKGPDVVINHNDLYDNHNYDLSLGYYQDAVSTTIDATRNWWNIVDVSLIAERIYDHSDNSNCPIVYFEPYRYCPSPPLSSPESLSYPSWSCSASFTTNWSVVDDEVNYYRLERSIDSSFNNPVTVYEGEEPFYTESGLSIGSYWYRILAADDCGEGIWMTGDHAVFVAPGIDPPLNISYPETDSDGNFTVTWPSVPDAVSYTVERDTNQLFESPRTVYTGQDLSYNELGLEYGTYWYRVRANNTCCDSDWRVGNHSITVSPPCEGNFDHDCDVDGSDLTIFAKDLGRMDCSIGLPCEGDFDGDGDVDGSDLAIFTDDFSRTNCPLSF